MSTTLSSSDQREHFISLLKKFHTAMLITTSDEEQSRVHGRPMAIAHVEDDGRLWFFTSDDSPKVHEIADDSHVYLTAQKGDGAFLTLAGRATLTADPQKISELWQEPFRVWFPGGKDDPSIELISVSPQSGEYWDTTGGSRLKYYWEAVKAYATHTKPEIEEGEQHGAVKL